MQKLERGAVWMGWDGMGWVKVKVKKKEDKEERRERETKR
jgi:hypothetical protein